MRKCPDGLVHLFIVPWPDRKPWGVATSGFWDQCPSKEFFTGSLLKRGRTKGRTSEHRNNVWETMDTRTGIRKDRHSQQRPRDNSMRKLEKNGQKRNTCNKHISEAQPFPPLPIPPEGPVENRHNVALSTPSVAGPNPSISSSGLQAGAFLSCLTSWGATPSLQGQNPFERNPILQIFVS